jgi:predicted methyltransferase
MKKLILGFAAVGLLATVSIGASGGMKLDNSTRPPADVERDAARQPAAMVKFAQIKSGQTVVDMLPGGGYFTRIFSQIVGPKGHVVALVPDQYAKAYPKAGTDITTLAADPAYKNVEAAIRSLTDLGPAGSVDRVWTAQNYHDMHLKAYPAGTAAAVNKAVYTALKPGGFYIILDHSAKAGNGFGDVDTLHRADEEALKAEVLAAGFKLVDTSRALANASDDRTKNVFDPAIRGKTDQFVLRFVKPKK